MACSGTGKGEIVWAIHRALFIRAGFKGLGAKRLWRVFRILRSSFKKVAVSERNENKKNIGGRGDASSVRLEYHWTFLSCSFLFS